MTYLKMACQRTQTWSILFFMVTIAHSFEANGQYYGSQGASYVGPPNYVLPWTGAGAGGYAGQFTYGLTRLGIEAAKSARKRRLKNGQNPPLADTEARPVYNYYFYNEPPAQGDLQVVVPIHSYEEESDGTRVALTYDKDGKLRPSHDVAREKWQKENPGFRKVVLTTAARDSDSTNSIRRVVHSTSPENDSVKNDQSSRSNSQTDTISQSNSSDLTQRSEDSGKNERSKNDDNPCDENDTDDEWGAEGFQDSPCASSKNSKSINDQNATISNHESTEALNRGNSSNKIAADPTRKSDDSSESSTNSQSSGLEYRTNQHSPDSSVSKKHSKNQRPCRDLDDGELGTGYEFLIPPCKTEGENENSRTQGFVESIEPEITRGTPLVDLPEIVVYHSPLPAPRTPIALPDNQTAATASEECDDNCNEEGATRPLTEIVDEILYETCNNDQNKKRIFSSNIDTAVDQDLLNCVARSLKKSPPKYPSSSPGQYYWCNKNNPTPIDRPCVDKAYASQITAAIEKAAACTGIDAKDIFPTINHESRFHPVHVNAFDQNNPSVGFGQFSLMQGKRYPHLLQEVKEKGRQYLKGNNCSFDFNSIPKNKTDICGLIGATDNRPDTGVQYTFVGFKILNEKINQLLNPSSPSHERLCAQTACKKSAPCDSSPSRDYESFIKDIHPYLGSLLWYSPASGMAALCNYTRDKKDDKLTKEDFKDFLLTKANLKTKTYFKKVSNGLKGFDKCHNFK